MAAASALLKSKNTNPFPLKSNLQPAIIMCPNVPDSSAEAGIGSSILPVEFYSILPEGSKFHHNVVILDVLA